MNFLAKNKLKDIIKDEDYSEFIGLLALKNVLDDVKDDKEFKVIDKYFNTPIFIKKE